MPVKILVADDSATMRKILEMTFAGEDAEVVTVENGDNAVAKARDIHPDVVFADLSMSGMDGYGIAQAIKSNPALNHAAVIVMASQHSPFDADRGQRSGVDEHIIKPFDTQAVIDKVAQVLSRPRARLQVPAVQQAVPPVAAPAPAQAPAPREDAFARPAAAAAAPVDLQKHAPPPPPPAPAPAPRMPIGAPQGMPSTRPASRPTLSFGSSPPPPGAGPANLDLGRATAEAARAAARPALELVDDEPVARPPSAPPPPQPQPQHQPPPPPPPRGASTAGFPAVAAAASDGSPMADRLRGMGLTGDQVASILQLSREVIEQVVWEVVPDLAETIIREEIRRLTA